MTFIDLCLTQAVMKQVLLLGSRSLKHDKLPGLITSCAAALSDQLLNAMAYGRRILETSPRSL